METQEVKSIFERLYREREVAKSGMEFCEAVMALEQKQVDLLKQIDILEKGKLKLVAESEKVSDVIKAGEEKAAEKIEAARKQSEVIVEAAKSKAEAELRAAEERADKIVGALDGLAKERVAALAEMDTLRAMVLSLQSDVERLEKVKADARKALGV